MDREQSASEQEVIRDEKGRFVPGHSGNPSGRPVRKPLTDALLEFLKEVDPRSKTGKSRMEEIAITLAVLASKGDIKAIKEIFDRIEGKPQQNLDVGGEAFSLIPELTKLVKENVRSEKDNKVDSEL